ncbi:MAG: hypothetical protein US43_C0037G0003 [Candidatus Levybacteria bacterium GW2011_GWA1_37_16]|nr:MAG: hypothetical protein US43_C0037G0003 [Candidatus Levybacteria bacterium GW2011_GWA1_37_16]
MALTLRLKLCIILGLGDALHRRECTLKNSKPTMIKSRKIDQIINARNSVSALRAERDLILAELFGVRPSLRLAIA